METIGKLLPTCRKGRNWLYKHCLAESEWEIVFLLDFFTSSLEQLTRNLSVSIHQCDGEIFYVIDETGLLLYLFPFLWTVHAVGREKAACLQKAVPLPLPFSLPSSVWLVFQVCSVSPSISADRLGAGAAVSFGRRSQVFRARMGFPAPQLICCDPCEEGLGNCSAFSVQAQCRVRSGRCRCLVEEWKKKYLPLCVPFMHQNREKREFT